MRTGYGVFGIAGGVLIGAHRAAWTFTHGPVPPGRFVCHHCDNRLCVRPAHLFLGDALANVRDMDAKGRRGAKQGEAHARAKLTRAAVEDIRARYVRGRNRYQRGNSRGLATRYGVDPSVVWRIVHGKAWRA